MSEKKFDLEDMALGDNEKIEKVDMDLESPSPSEVEAKIKEVFPNEEEIPIAENLIIKKMANGDYKVNGITAIQDLETEDLNKIDNFLNARKG